MLRRPGRIEILFAPEGNAGSGASTATPGASTAAPAPSAGAASGAATSSPSGASSSQAPTPATSSSPVTPSPDLREDGKGTSSSPSNAPDVPDWSFDDIDVEASLDAIAGTTKVPASAEPKTESQAEPPAPVTQVAPAEVKPAEPPKVDGEVKAPGAERQSPHPAEMPPEQLAQTLQANERVIEQALAKELFALSEEDIEALDTNAAGFIPTLLARGYLKGQVNMLNTVARVIPSLIQTHLKAGEASRSNEDAFYATWKQLDRSKHSALVREVASMYRKMNPEATKGQMFQDVGQMVMLRAGIPLVASPQTPQRAANGRSPPPSPFVPVTPGVSAMPQQGTTNPWEVDPTAMDE